MTGTYDKKCRLTGREADSYSRYNCDEGEAASGSFEFNCSCSSVRSDAEDGERFGCSEIAIVLNQS